jgi:hypothetical protein
MSATRRNESFCFFLQKEALAFLLIAIDPQASGSFLKKRTKKLSLIAAAMLCLCPAIARAYDAPLSADQTALAIQVVQAIGIQQVADAAMGGLRMVLVQSLAARNNQPADKVAGIVDQILVPDLRALEPQFIASVADSYGHAFTTPEMEQILAFYQTPVGMKLQQLTPGLTQQMVASGHAWIEQAATQVLQADAGKLSAQGLSTQ